jgi:thiamine-phosphate pyrophosphorylase
MKNLRGLYLVVDTTIPEEKLFPVIEQALEGGVDILQLWGTWKDQGEALRLGRRIHSLARKHQATLLIADDVDLCGALDADGVHFDGYALPRRLPADVRKEIGTDKIIGVTCGNNKEKLLWAEENGADYISFCSMFPSSSVDSCELVPLEMVREAKRMLSIPVFASGGITFENIDQVLEAGADGIAVVSAILKAAQPRAVAQQFKKKIEAYAVRQRNLRGNNRIQPV